MIQLKPSMRYIQVAFNHTDREVRAYLPQIPRDPRIFVEAGTPFIKREGMRGISLIRRMWPGMLVADLKIMDGALEEIWYASQAGANAATCLGAAARETLDIFIKECARLRMYSMIDMINVNDPLKRLMPLKHPPDFVVIHKGRDEESSQKAMIRYRDISKLRGKYAVYISVAGGLVPDKVRSTYFNGANNAILNVVKPGSGRSGLVEGRTLRNQIAYALKEAGF